MNSIVKPEEGQDHATAPPTTQNDAIITIDQDTILPQMSTPVQSADGDNLDVSMLKQLLESRDREIQMLKFELEKYKLALHQSQPSIKDKTSTIKAHDNKETIIDSVIVKPSAAGLSPLSEEGHETLGTHTHTDATKSIQFTGSANMPSVSHCRVVFRTGDDDDEQNNNDEDAQSAQMIENICTDSSGDDELLQINQTNIEVIDDDDDNDDDVQEKNDIVEDDDDDDDDDEDNELQDIIQDVGEIDLSLEFEAINEDSKKEKSCSLNREESDIEEADIISDGLLTSLTDAAISNLSQLAALQERCESQQHSHKYQQKQAAGAPVSIRSSSALDGAGHRSTSSGASVSSPTSSSLSAHHHNSSLSGGLHSGSSIMSSGFSSSQRRQQQQQHHGPFCTTAIANQAALAISAAAASVPALQQQQQQQQQQQAADNAQLQLVQPISAATSPLSPNSTIQADLSSSNSLANVVAAAAVAAAANAAAAAAANDSNNNNPQQQPPHQQQQHQQQQQHHHHLSSPINHSHTTSLSSGSRLSSALSPSPEFYHTLQQQQQHHHHQHHHAQPQHHHHHQQQQSSSSSLHFSSSVSVTPSPSSLMLGAGSSQSRRSPSNTSSSLMSPIASPNYLRRQFMPDRLPLLSPSPTAGSVTGLATGGTVGSTSLAHILNQHHHHHQAAAAAVAAAAAHPYHHHHHHHQQQQQRSASALPGGPLSLVPSSSTGGTPLSTSSSTAVSPLMSNKNSSQARLNNMQIRHKFGYLGSGRAQFNSPHGFCLGLNQEIVVADTNNHRVCIFDKSGTYITQFGSPGKEEGQLWNPRKVAILHRPVSGTNSGGNSSNSLYNQQLQTSSSSSTLPSPYSSGHHNNNINSNNNNINNNNNNSQSNTINNNTSEPLYVVCDRGAERSRMQLFTKDGAFIKKIGIHYIDIVAGLAITQNGLIIVVDSVSPTVYIINGETGILNGWFDCSGYMKEPSDIAVKSDVPGNEYFICDFKGHCVVVFSEQGEYLRKIGHDGLTSYPNGIDISDDGDILVGDSHGNRFHVVVFDRNGNFVSQFECPHVKVSRCCGLKITREGYIVTLAKNNHHVLVLDTIHI